MSPVTPEQVAKKKGQHIPKVVFDAFDALIIQNYADGKSVVIQSEVVERVKKTRQDFNSDWLNVEAAYEAIGWTVDYDKPAYNETYAAKFTFTAKRADEKGARR